MELGMKELKGKNNWRKKVIARSSFLPLLLWVVSLRMFKWERKAQRELYNTCERNKRNSCTFLNQYNGQSDKSKNSTVHELRITVKSINQTRYPIRVDMYELQKFCSHYVVYFIVRIFSMWMFFILSQIRILDKRDKLVKNSRK